MQDFNFNFNCSCKWDQRIPNEPIFQRQFNITRPPIIPQDGPRSTSRSLQCQPRSCSRPWMLMSKDAEQQMMRYWVSHSACNNIGGVNKCITAKDLDQMTRMYPDRPWLSGIHRNVDHESKLLNHNYYNPKDCVIPKVKKELKELDRIVDTAMLRKMTDTQLFRNGSLCDDQLWNQSTSLRQNEPVDFDYERYIRSCHS